MGVSPIKNSNPKETRSARLSANNELASAESEQIEHQYVALRVASAARGWWQTQAAVPYTVARYKFNLWYYCVATLGGNYKFIPDEVDPHHYPTIKAASIQLASQKSSSQ